MTEHYCTALGCPRTFIAVSFPAWWAPTPPSSKSMSVPPLSSIQPLLPYPHLPLSN